MSVPKCGFGAVEVLAQAAWPQGTRTARSTASTTTSGVMLALAASNPRMSRCRSTRCASFAMSSGSTCARPRQHGLRPRCLAERDRGPWAGAVLDQPRDLLGQCLRGVAGRVDQLAGVKHQRTIHVDVTHHVLQTQHVVEADHGRWVALLS